DKGRYSDGCYEGMRLAEVHTGEHVHQSISWRTPGFLPGPKLPSCKRGIPNSYDCSALEAQSPDMVGVTDNGDYEEQTVSLGHYLMIGDSRDNSSDGRFWGYVPE